MLVGALFSMFPVLFFLFDFMKWILDRIAILIIKVYELFNPSDE